MTTPGQTIGPFFGYSLPYPGDSQLVPHGADGAIRLYGRVLDGAGDPVPDALLEIWQADVNGTVLQRPGSLQRDGWTFTGWGRAATDATGAYSFTTLRPGTVEGASVPFFALTVFARGLLHRLRTRAYLPDGPVDTDPLLAGLATERRSTLIAAAEPDGYEFNIVLQGPGETVFLGPAQS